MLPPKSREPRAGGDAPADSTAPSGAAMSDERLSHLQAKYPDPRSNAPTTGATPAAPTATAPTGEDPGAMLVGGGVELKGRIGSCDALVVEGKVEATIECGSIKIRGDGVVTGDAKVQSASVQGRFEGELAVSGCLTIHAGGRVTGSVRYGEIEVERGAQIAGDIAPEGVEGKPRSEGDGQGPRIEAV